MATLAVFIALGGTSYAVATGSIDSRELKNNGVRSRDLRNNDVRSNDIRNGTVEGRDIRNEAITGADVSERTLGQVPDAGAVDGLDSSVFLRAGGKAADASLLDGLSSTAFVRYGSTIPSGVTVRGVFGGSERSDANGTFLRLTVSLPAAAPVALTSDAVNFAPNSPAGTDDDPSCVGSVSNPTAPAGKACLYEASALIGSFSGQGTGVPSTDSSAFGFGVQVQGGTAAGVFGTWAYTAP